MRKILIFILIIIVFIFSLNSCTKKENKEVDIFYGETEKWVVIGNVNNSFNLIYKGNLNDLKKDNSNNSISIFYGTSLGTTGDTQLLSNTNYYQQKFKDDFITGLSTNNTLNSGKLMNVQISYGITTDSIDMVPYYK